MGLWSKKESGILYENCHGGPFSSCKTFHYKHTVVQLVNLMKEPKNGQLSSEKQILDIFPT